MITDKLLFFVSLVNTKGELLSFLLAKILLGEILLGRKKLFLEAVTIFPLE